VEASHFTHVSLALSEITPENEPPVNKYNMAFQYMHVSLVELTQMIYGSGLDVLQELRVWVTI
jgi:hypothetical protein